MEKRTKSFNKIQWKRLPNPTTRERFDVQIEGNNLVDDFIFDSGTGDLAAHTLHIRNAPSPAATSSLAIARVIAEKAEEHFVL